MTKDECKSEEPNRQCPAYHSDDDHSPACRSDKEKSGSCSQDTENPSGITCPGPITSVNDPKQYVQKWKCYNPNAENNDDFKVDMYAVDSKMPLNGFCILDLVDEGR